MTVRRAPDGRFYPYDDDHCPGHVASPEDRKVCALCGTHVDELRPPEDEDDA